MKRCTIGQLRQIKVGLPQSDEDQAILNNQASGLVDSHVVAVPDSMFARIPKPKPEAKPEEPKGK